MVGDQLFRAPLRLGTWGLTPFCGIFDYRLAGPHRRADLHCGLLLDRAGMPPPEAGRGWEGGVRGQGEGRALIMMRTIARPECRQCPAQPSCPDENTADACWPDLANPRGCQLSMGGHGSWCQIELDLAMIRPAPVSMMPCRVQPVNQTFMIHVAVRPLTSCCPRYGGSERG